MRLIGFATAEVFVREGPRSRSPAATRRDWRRPARSWAAPSPRSRPTSGCAPTCSAWGSRSPTRSARKDSTFFGNAGVAFSTPLLTTDEARYDELMDVDVKRLFFSMQAVVPVLCDGASVSLNSAWLNAVGKGGFSALAATKSAVRSFARSWSCELMDRKILINAVSPGAIDTPIFELEGNTPEQMAEAKRQMALRIPAGRRGQPEVPHRLPQKDLRIDPGLAQRP